MTGRWDVRSKMLSTGVLAYGATFGIVGTWAVMLVGMPVVFVWPKMMAFSWLLFVPMLLSAALFVLYFLQDLEKVRFDDDCVTVLWMGITVQRIPVSEIKLFCAIRSQREVYLCLSCYEEAELARRWEEKLMRGLLTRSSVELRKRKPDWRGTFAGEYLNHLRKNPLVLFRQRGTVMLEMKPEFQNLIRKRYPQILYRNYTGMTSYYATRNGYSKDNHAIVLMDYQRSRDCTVEMDAEGLRLIPKKGQAFLVPAREIRTILRVDVFLPWSNYGPPHLSLVMVSCMAEEDLVYLAPRMTWDMIDKTEPDRQALLAMVAASQMALRIAPPDQKCCVMHFTENNIRKLRELYPHAHFNDISACWLENT